MTGTLTISGGISRLEGTRLMKGGVNNGGFGRATNFLEQDRGLRNNDEIWVDGTNDTFNQMPVILITNAGKAVEGLVSMAAGKARRSAGKTQAKKKSVGSAKKKSPRKGRKSTKSTKTGARKAIGAKKSGGKTRSR